MEDPATSVTTSSIWASLNSWFTSTVFFVLLNLMIATIVFTSNLPDNNNNNINNQPQEQEDHKKNPQNDRNQPQIARSPSILHRLKSFNFYPQKSQHESSTETHYQQHPLEVAATQYVFNQPLDYQHFDFDKFDSTVSDPIEASGNQIYETQTRVENVTHDYDFDGIRQETGGNTAFDFDPTVERNDGDTADENADVFESLDEVYSRLKTGGHDRTKSDGNISTKPPTKLPAKMKKSASLKVGFSNLEEVEIVEARRPATVKEKRSAVKVADDHDDDVGVDSKADDFINKFKNDLKLQRIESIIRTKGATNRGTGK